MGRRSVWSDDEVRALTRHFVLAADEVWRLQGGRDAAAWRESGGTDPECLAFQEMAAAGHYGPGAGSKQGIYVCAPSGAFLASINSNEPRRVAATLIEGLEKWRELTAAERAATIAAQPEHRFENAWPEDGLAITTTMRYLPVDADPAAEKARDYNHDALWFSKEEARSFLPGNPAIGATQTLPAPLFERIARFNLVDAVRGETRPFGDVEGSIDTTVTAVDGARVYLRLTGHGHAHGQPQRRGLSQPLELRARLLGHAAYDLDRERFVEFEFVGIGARRSPERTRRGRRTRSPVRNLGWYFTLTPPRQDGFYVAPTHIRSYGGAWAANR